MSSHNYLSHHVLRQHQNSDKDKDNIMAEDKDEGDKDYNLIDDVEGEGYDEAIKDMWMLRKLTVKIQHSRGLCGYHVRKQVLQHSEEQHQIW